MKQRHAITLLIIMLSLCFTVLFSQAKELQPMNTSNSQAVYIDNTQFLDISSHWAKEDIEHMLSLGIVKGKTPQTFAPDLNINRAEFAALVLRALEPQIEFYSEIKTDEFIDINEDAWYKDIVYTAVEIGLFADESNYFRPEESIT